jgi:2-hydroxy-3-oxopropionate reductase
MIKRTFQPGFRIRHQQKDLNNALSAARQLGISLPGSANAQELYNAVVADGGADLDHSALVTALERMAKHTVA